MGDRRFTYAELDDYLTSGNRDFATEGARHARDLFCNLWYLHPDQVVNNLSLVPPFLEATYDRACRPRTPALPPPAVYLPGGQCPGTVYGISYSAANANTTQGFISWQPPFNPIPPTYHNGPVPPIRLGVANNILLPGYSHWSVGNQSSGIVLPNNQRRYYVIIDGIWIPLNVGTGCKLNGWIRISGDPDNCGNPPPTYLPTNNISISESNITTIVTLQDNRTIQMPISLVTRGSNNSLNIPVTINVGGVFFDIDLAGVVVRNENNRNSFGGDNDGILNGAVDGGGEDDGGGGLGREPIPSDNTEDFEETPVSPEEGEEIEDIERLGYVKVKLTTIPTNAKSFAGLGAPNVYMAGWLNFKAGSHNFPKQFIDFTENIFIAPIGSDGFNYHLNLGYTAEVRIVQVRE